MLTFLVFAKLLILLLSLLGAVIYAGRRRDARYAIRALRKTPVVRALDEAEFAALEPFRLTGQLAESREVRNLADPYSLEHDEAQLLHERLGEVEVVLPYDARQFVPAQPRAEVVLGHSQAIVVRMNGFDIAAGLVREQVAKAEHYAWLATERQTTPAPPVDDAAQGQGLAPVAGPQIDCCSSDLPAQREETPEERALRQPQWLGLPSAGCYLLACLLLWLGTMRVLDLPWLMLVAGIVSASVGVALTRPRRRPLPAAGTVNQFKGTLGEPRPQPIGQVEIDTPVLEIGNVQVNAPRHWCTGHALPLGQPVIAEVRTADRYLLSLNPGRSLVEEARRLPPSTLGRHLVWLGTAMLATLWSLQAGNAVFDDLRIARHALHVPALRSDPTPATVLAAPPRPGDRVSLQGDGTCGIAALLAAGHTLAQSDCRQTLWGGPAIELPGIVLPPTLDLLDRDDAMRVEISRLELLALQSTFPSRSTAGHRNRILGVAPLVEALERVCLEGVVACDALRDRLLELLLPALQEKAGGRVPRVDGNRWEYLSDTLRGLAQAHDDTVYLGGADLKALYEIQLAIVREFAQHKLADIGSIALATPTDGLVLIDVHRAADIRPSVVEAPLEHWQHTRDQVSQQRPFALRGWVVGREHDVHGLRLHIDTRSEASPFTAALVHSVWRALAVLLLGVQTLLLLRCTRQTHFHHATWAPSVDAETRQHQ